RAGLHNHLDQMVEGPEEVHKCMAMTDPRLFHFSPDTAHLHLGGSNVVEMFQKYKTRLMFMDYKDARWTTPPADVKLDNGTVHPKDSKSARFFSSIYDLGDGEVDFPSCHRVLKEIQFKGWICVDLDTARRGPRASYERSGRYVVEKLEPIYS
ncbi:MAG: xylose isomerase, partial [Acidobacteria bacterium]|nr:xylose isomerase [Acidobacteriota bacterium]